MSKNPSGFYQGNLLFYDQIVATGTIITKSYARGTHA